MRLVRFEDPSGALALDLHPLLTVISGMPERAREQLIAAVAALPRGGDPGGVGTIEVHGVYLELTRPSLELLELHQELDVVLRAGDLPGAELRADPAPAAFSPTAPGAFSSGPSGTDLPIADDQRDSAVRVMDELRATGDELTRVLNEAHARLRDLSAARASLDARLNAARDAVDPFAAAAAKVARDELDEIERRVSAAPAPQAPPERNAELELRLAERRAATGPLRAEVERLAAIDPAPVRLALEQLQRGARQVQVPSPEAERLLHEWRSYGARRSAFETRRSGSRNLLAEVTARRDRAYDEFVEAERTLRAPQLDSKLVDELEAVHDELFELDGRSGKIGGAKLRRRVEELRELENRLLAKLGFDTWSSYVMGVSSGGADMQRAHRFQVAQSAYQLAEDELARVAAGSMQDDAELRALEDIERRLRQRIGTLIGREPGRDPEADLRMIRHEVPAVGGEDRSNLAAQLAASLRDTGASLPPGELGVPELEAVAEGWLDAMRALPARVGQIRAELGALEQQIAGLERELAATRDVQPVAAAVSDVELRMARDRLADASRRLAAHEAANQQVAALHDELALLARREDATRLEITDYEARLRHHHVELRAAQQRAEELDAAARRRAEREAWLASAAPVSAPHTTLGAVDIEAIEWYVLARLAQQRSVSFVGSVPLVVLDAFAGWQLDDMREVFARLERMSEVIQIVYLTEDPAILSWSRALGEERALTLELSARV